MKTEVRLDEACELVMGQAPDGESYNAEGKGWPLIAGAGDFGESSPAPGKYTQIASRLTKPGDIVLAIRATIGEKVLADNVYCLGRGVAALRPKRGLDSRYLWHWLDHVRPELNSKARGATFRQVTKRDVGEIEISLPPLPEQRRIAEILDKADALRAKRREAIALLDTLTKAVFLEMFGDPIINSRGWPSEKFSSLGTLERGMSKHRPRNAPELLGGPYPLVQTGDVASSDGYIRSYSNTYSEAGLHQSKLWNRGTLCITIAANIAKTGILTFDACFPDSVVGFCSQNAATVEYVRTWLSFLQKTLEDNAPESAQKNINLAILRELDVCVPPLALQQEFSERVAAVERLRTPNRASLEELDELFASLQHRAFTGEL